MRMSELEYAAYLHRRGQRSTSADAVLTEAGLVEHIRALAKRGGFLCYHTHDSRKSEPGFPDLVMTNGRRLLCWEVKTSTGKLTVAQARWLALLERVPGVDARVVRPQDLGAIEGWLRGEGV